MAYTINLTNGTVFATINDGTINQIASGTPSVPLITLVGKNYAGYGAFLDSNFVHLLESGSNSIAPTAPLTGQLWWDSSSSLLKIYSGTGFKSITGATSSASAPTTTVIAGDLWFDTSNQQLKVYTGSTWLVVGPGYTSAQGTSGAIPETILNSVGATKYITSLYVNNTRVGVVYDGASFTPQVSLQTAFPTIYPGLTLSASVSGAVFAGSATNAQLLDSLDSSDFMRATANTATTGRLQVNNANGIYIGTSNVVNISQSTNDGLITAAVSGGNLIIQTNVAGVTYNVARALGASGTFAIANAATVGTTLSVTGNVTGGNLITAAAISAASVSASGNVTGGNLNAGTGNISSTGNVQAGNLLTTGLISSTGNITTAATGNISTGNISITGKYSGDGSGLTNLGALAVGSIANGTSTIGISGSGGNGFITIGGTANVAVFTSTTAYFIGNANVTGIEHSGSNAVGNIGATGSFFNTVFAATHNGATVSASGNVTGANVNTGILSATGAVTFSGTTDNMAVGTSLTTGVLTLGAATQTGTLTIGQSTDSQTTNIQTGATATAKTKAINVGTGGLAGSTTTIAIGPVSATNAAGTTTFNTATTVAIANTSGTALSVAGNITGGNIAATGHTGTTVSVTGNITGGNINAAGLSLSSNVVSQINSTANITTTGNISGGNIIGTIVLTSLSTAGNVTAGNLAVSGVLLSTNTVSAAGNITGGNVLGGALVNATSHTGTTVSVTGNITGGNIITAGVLSVSGGGSIALGTGNVTLGNVNNGGLNGVGNIGASGAGFNTVFALATSAQYADLAERYAADAVLEPGTVVDLGGTHEITQSQQDLSDAVFGVISTSAAYMMNNSAGSDATHPLVAIAGRVPTKVTGAVRKGDRLVSAGNGTARAAHPGEATWLNVIGRALENKDSTELGMIEATVSVK